MLFGYPIAATQNNWLHDCLCAAVRNVHAAIDFKKKYPGWPTVLPAAHRATLNSRTGLRDRLKGYNSAARKLTKADRDVVLQAVEEENRIADLLSGVRDCARVNGLPEAVREPVASLFGFAFDLLTEVDDLRDRHYAAIYAGIPARVCPFCGTEQFDAPGAAREALDHYLTKTLYPFAAANLRNLVPMGYKCNSSYKKVTDLLRDANGSRRVAIDPYSHSSVKVSLEDSDPFNGTTPNTPNWNIRFDPDSKEVSTWDYVFSVRERFRRDHLDASFPAWLDLFRQTARHGKVGTMSDAELIEVLRRLENGYSMEGMQDRAFLKAEVFRMLRLRCEAGHQRLLELLRNLVDPLAMVAAVAGPAVSQGTC